MGFIVYYAIMIISNCIIAVVKNEWVCINFDSLLPVTLIALMTFQTLYFRHESSQKGFETAYNSNYSYDQLECIYHYTVIVHLLLIPTLFPFVLFFALPLKFVSLLIYLISFVAGPIFYKIKKRKEIRFGKRYLKDELRIQNQKEELGKWK